ncbi:MAG TPA: MqnA/MqnD/SBP family protein [Phycisphaerae bacterium]|nr:MqnA/MqnD/SBP family protein [Phycisphaerae bacterium]
MLIKLGHSPDPDDAFMFYALAKELISTGPYVFEHILKDIQTLNDWAVEGRLEVTAISIHAYPYVQDKYVLLDSGSSMGDRYGPLVVARRPMQPAELAKVTIAVPGKMTTAFLALSLMLGKDAFDYKVMPFDAILGAVALGEADAGLIIHEGQLTFEQQGLVRVVDMGQWWYEQTQLPLPLGGNVIRRDLPQAALTEVPKLLNESIRYSLDHRTEAVEHALQFARDMDITLADQFVGMYVNEWTLSYGEVGRQAVRELLRRGHEAGITPAVEQIEFL